VSERADKPSSVPKPEPGWRPSIWGGGYPPSQAANPRAENEQSPGEPVARPPHPPIWPCSRWGLPSRPSHLDRWWSLTPPFHAYQPGKPDWRIVLCGTVPSGHPAWTLSSIVLCEARTFLRGSAFRRIPCDRLARSEAIGLYESFLILAQNAYNTKMTKFTHDAEEEESMDSKPTFEEIISKYSRALVLVAHPDDPEFFCGGTVARLAQAGLTVHYLILTSGDKGGDDRSLSNEELAAIRVEEQEKAARHLGVAQVTCLKYPDGFLTPSYEVLRDAVRYIRRFKPDIVLTQDPGALYTRGVSHRDHRAAGLIALDAVFPAARNHRYFPELLQEGLEPHVVRELWICRTTEPDLDVDISAVFDLRTEALLNHKTQIRDPKAFVERMNNYRASQEGPVLERYRRLVLG